MTKKFVNLLIIDASGSMSRKEKEVRDGIYEIFKSIKKQMRDNKDVSYRTIVIEFSDWDDINVIVNTTDRRLLSRKTANSYRTRGLTALRDAIGYGFSLVEDSCDDVYVNIITDGNENDSKKVSESQLKNLIKEKMEKGWGITFMAVNDSVIKYAQRLGIDSGNTLQYENTKKGTKLAQETVVETMTLYSERVYKGESTATRGKGLVKERIIK